MNFVLDSSILEFWKNVMVEKLINKLIIWTYE